MPTHGSLTKAGRVRGTTPNVPKTSKRKSHSPLRTRRKRVKKAVVLGLIDVPNIKVTKPTRRRKKKR